MEGEEGEPARLRDESGEEYREDGEFLGRVGEAEFFLGYLQKYTIETEDTKEDELVGDKWGKGRKGEGTKKTYDNTAPSKPDKGLGDPSHTVYKIH